MSATKTTYEPENAQSLDLGPRWTDQYGRGRDGSIRLKTDQRDNRITWSNDWTALVLASYDAHPRLKHEEYPHLYGHTVFLR